MNTAHIDLNLIRLAAVLFETKNTSRAARVLGVTQSAVSHALARLRSQFDDPLFVRAAKGVEPTEFARSIKKEILELVQRADDLAARRLVFDPKQAEGRITVASTDYFEAVVMPRLLHQLEQEAPRLQISLRPTAGELPKRELENGRIDFAVAGFYEDLPEGFYQTSLYTDSFLCAVGAKHPLASRVKLTEKDFFEARHALISLQGDLRDPLAEKRKRGRGIAPRGRQFAYGSYSFTGMAWVLQESALLLTAPKLLIDRYARYFPVKTWNCPVDIGDITLRMVWHEQTHENPLRIWLRKKIKQICEGL